MQRVAVVLVDDLAIADGSNEASAVGITGVALKAVDPVAVRVAALGELTHDVAIVALAQCCQGVPFRAAICGLRVQENVGNKET